MWFWRKKSLTTKEIVHNDRRREIGGCAHCCVEVRPGNDIMVCRLRFDRWTLCVPCYKKALKANKATPMTKEKLYWEVDPSTTVENCKTVSEAIQATLKVFHDRPLLGYPLSTTTTNTDDDIEYHWLSYEEVLTHATQLGNGLKVIINERSLKLLQQNNVSPSSSSLDSTSISQKNQAATVILYAEASVEWYLFEYACLLKQFLVVPVLDATREHQLEIIIERCNPEFIIVSSKKYETVATILSGSTSCVNITPPIVVVISPAGTPPYTHKSTNKHANMSSTVNTNIADLSSTVTNVLHTSDIAEMGKRHCKTSRDQTFNTSKSNEDAEQLDTPRMLIPTSGSTGTPKLVILTDNMVIRQFKSPDFAIRTVMYSFQPLRQSFDTLIKGGCIGLWSGDLGSIHRDMQVLCPTAFGSTPVFWIAQYQRFNADLQTAFSQLMTTDITPEIKETLRTNLMKKWREKRLLGNRCRVILIGGAPSSEDVKDWIWEVFGPCQIIDGYGTTEAGAIATNHGIGSHSVNETSHIQLIDVPDMGYLTSDTPYPRGEVVAYTKRVTPGYYNDPVANENSFIKIAEKRYFRTGDIGMLVEGKLTLIDRKNALFKLANGVFVAPAPLENLFSASTLIKQVLVYGTSGARSISIVVVPSLAGIEACSQESSEIEGLEMDPKPILKECARLAMEAGRREHEIPQNALLTREEWTVDNGCLTSTFKLCRPELLKRFVHSQDLNKSTQHNNQRALIKLPLTCKGNNSDVSRGLSAGLIQVLREHIPSLASIESVIPSGDTTVYSLGVDSLAIALLRSALQCRFGITIPLTQLAGSTLLDLNAAIFGAGAISLPDVEDGPESLQDEAGAVRDCWRNISIHNNQGKSLNNNEFFDESKVKTSVLLTGVTGFVGAFLLDELLRNDIDAHVVCLVRANTNMLARERVNKTLKQYHLQCNSNRWSVIAGNLAEEKFGISEDEWSQLLNSVHTVYHVGAIVNASLPLSAIRSSNITGTKTIVEFCVSAKAFLHHISTISVLTGSTITNETFNIPPPGKYASAYAKSKWVAEQIVGYGISELGLGARIYRLGTMSCHSVTGACNPNDTFTRIIKGVIDMGVFTDHTNSPLPDGFYLTAIDWSVKAICNISKSSLEELQNLQLVDTINVNGGDSELVEVFHILNKEFFSMSTAFNYIRKHGIPLINLTPTAFMEKLSNMEPTNAMYTFRDVYKKGGGGRGVDTVSHISTTKTLKFIFPPPEVDETVMLKMLNFLQSFHETKSSFAN